jgi:hypothetical protein
LYEIKRLDLSAADDLLSDTDDEDEDIDESDDPDSNDESCLSNHSK